MNSGTGIYKSGVLAFFAGAILIGALLGAVTFCFNCYPVIRKHVIQPYYDQRGESNPEFAYKDADPDEKLFEDRAAEETPVKTKESRKKGKTIS